MNGLQAHWTGDAELVYDLELPMETPSNNVIKGMHFQEYKKLRHGWHLLVLKALNGERPLEPLALSFLEVERACAGGGLDWDNAYGGLKPLLDCLVSPSARNPDGLGLIADDNPKAMPLPPFVRQVGAKPGSGTTRLKIYRLRNN